MMTPASFVKRGFPSHPPNHFHAAIDLQSTNRRRSAKVVSVYVRLLDAEADGADWMEASVTILHIDPIREPMRAYRAWETHLSRAKWMAENGYQQLVRPVH
jgi:hypothetical protein